ncbi:DUF2927 domain-containing protein [uncultured Methanobacterium sp.]|uniref:DUF2927 domain-containing protein n=1 Tax=uncultured Methanobacterium sp. TaxID=176306 RepID=UPI002AA7F726|nr:DUF2927 domain-containing protein [uncultured Methanobacterium sp.]
MPYLVCEKCGGYYKLQEGESPDDFLDKCECGGDLKYSKTLDINSLDTGSFNNELTEDTTDYNSSKNIYHADDSDECAPDNYSTDSPVKMDLKSLLHSNLFKISIILAVMIILIVSVGLITHKSNSYGAFNFNVYEKYSDDEIATFLESEFSPNDYGNSYDRVGKWNINVVRIKVMGSPTSEDLKTLNKAINDINTNVKDFQLKIDDNNQFEPDMEIYFIPHSEFSKYSVNPSEVDGFALWKVSTNDIYGGNSAGEIYKARVFIGIDGLSQERRSHVIVHELAHGLGLHHNHNQNSVLCINGSDLTEFSDVDKTMIRILYREDILPDMSRNQVEIILNNSRKSFF